MPCTILSASKHAETKRHLWLTPRGFGDVNRLIKAAPTPPFATNFVWYVKRITGVGQHLTNTPVGLYMTVCMLASLLKTPLRTYSIVLADPTRDPVILIIFLYEVCEVCLVLVG